MLQEFLHRSPPMTAVQLGLNFAFQSGGQKARYHKKTCFALSPHTPCIQVKEDDVANTLQL